MGKGGVDKRSVRTRIRCDDGDGVGSEWRQGQGCVEWFAHRKLFKTVEVGCVPLACAAPGNGAPAKLNPHA